MNDFEILIPFQKEVGADGSLRLFGGIASTTSVDRDNERMDKAVMPKIAADLRKNSTVFFNHNTKGLAVGKLARVEEKGDEVYIDVIPTKADGMKDVVTQIHEGTLKSFSIGGHIKDYENKFDEKLDKNVKVITDVEVYEVSVVGVASNRDASILSYIAKSFQGDKVEDEKGKETAKAAAGKGEDTEKCSHAMVKCAKCNKEMPYEPSLGPGEIQRKAKELLDTPEFKKVVEEFDKKHDDEKSALAKSHEAKLDDLKKSFDAERKDSGEKLDAANARIELLRKAVDDKSKSLAQETDDLQKNGEAEIRKAAETKTAQEPKMSVLKRV